MSEMTQKQKGLIGLGAMVVLGGIAVLGSDAIYKAVDNIGKTPASYTAGTYTATAQGFGGDVVATVTVTEGEIVSVELVGNSETQGIGSNAIEQLPAVIVEAQSAEVDGVSGATISSGAVKEAVTNALAQASGEAPIQTAAATEAAAETEAAGAADSSAAGNYADGTYTATAKGFGGDIEATVTISGGKIESVELVGDSETQGIGSNAVEQLPAAIVEAQSAEIDGVSGATVSSGAIREAVTDCLTQAGAN